MRRTTAKKSMELADETVRGVFKMEKENQTDARSALLKKIELLSLGRRIRHARNLWGFSETVFATASGLDTD